MPKKKRKPPGPPKTKEKDPIRSIRVPEAEWEAWRKIAYSQGLSIAAWIRKIANDSAAL